MVIRHLSRCVLLAALILPAAGCYKWASSGQPIEEVAASGGETVRVWTTTGEQITLRDVRLADTLLIGEGNHPPDTLRASDVRSYQLERHDTAATVLVIAIPVAIIVALALSASSAAPAVCC